MPGSTPETPKAVGQVVDKIIKTLNERWNLQLPRLHGRSALVAEQTKSSLAKRCSGRIRYLCFRLPTDQLDRILEDFEDRARTIYSKWVFKPRQEKGTIPLFPITKSTLAKELSIKRSRPLGLATLSTTQREQLLKLLDSCLEDDFKLSRESDAYPGIPHKTNNALPEPPSSPSPIAPRTRAKDIITSHTTMSSYNESPNLTEKAQGTKKRAADPLPRPSSTNKKQRLTVSSRQVSLLDMYQVQDGGSSSHLKQSLPSASFETSASPPPPEVFTPALTEALSSKNTSFCTEPDLSDQDYFPTQDAHDILGDSQVRRSLESVEGLGSSAMSPQNFVKELEQCGPFSQSDDKLPSETSFEYRYELRCFADLWTKKELQLFQEMATICCGDSILDAQKRWNAIKQIAEKDKSKVIIERFGDKMWDPRSKLPVHERRHKSIYLSATLEEKGSSGNIPFKLRLHAPIIDKSCRFHRVFGSTRFLMLKIPYPEGLTSSIKSKRFSSNPQNINTDIIEWLSKSNHFLAGRYWRPFWVDRKGDKSSKVNKGKPYCKIHMFAVRGVGLIEAQHPEYLSTPLRDRAVSIEDFIRWHVPISDNLTTTDLKLFARFQLGLSKTTPTVVLRQDEFIEAPDKMSDDDRKIVMNDGCALMSLDLARDLAKMLGLLSIPSAFQGRISGAKGLWIVDRRGSRRSDHERNYWIEITPSQLKIQPHPRRRDDTCDELRTFEVSDFSVQPSEASLNKQLLLILDHQKVPRSVLKNRLLATMQEYYSELCIAMSDTRALCFWLQNYHAIGRGQEDLVMAGALPDSTYERLMLLLGSGFEPQTCSYIQRMLVECLRDSLTQRAEKLSMKVCQSTHVFCIADPYDVLEAGEVHLCFSQGWPDPNNGIPAMSLDDQQVLLARNPANQPSDIQKRTAVYKRELREFVDVIVFSTKGERSLASLLSGGDYDGDKVWVCWDAEFVASFKNEDEVLTDKYKPQACGLESRSVELAKIFQPLTPNDAQVDKFLYGCVAFNMTQPYLGICTHQHETLVYHLDSIRDDRTLKLAALASFLVDAEKQGYELPLSNWRQVRAEATKGVRMDKPAYSFDEKNAGPKWKSDNILDFLRFDVARVEKERILTDYSLKWPVDPHYDPILAKVYKVALERAKKESALGNHWRSEQLKYLKSEVQKVVEEWKKKADPSTNFRLCAQQIWSQTRRIKPQDSANNIMSRFEDGLDENLSYWNLLRASCFYHDHWRLNVVWYAVGKELSRLKAESMGEVRYVTRKMQCCTKMDGKAVKKFTAAGLLEMDHMDKEEEFGLESFEDVVEEDWDLLALA